MRHKLTILLSLGIIVCNRLNAQEISKPVIAIYEKQRELAILPLQNNTAYKDLDYLQNGIAHFLVSQLSDIVYIRVNKAGLKFIINPDNANIIDLLRKQKYLPGVNQKTPDRLERVKLVSRFEMPGKNNWKIRNLSDIKKQANELSVDYLVKGSFRLKNPAATFERYSLSNQFILITIQLYDANTSQINTWNVSLKIDQVYNKSSQLSSRIKKKLTGPQNANLAINTTHSGSLVFIDDLYLGKTPLNINTVAGIYQLTVIKEGQQTIKRQITLKTDSTTSLNIPTKLIPKQAGLILDSNPPGAKVYLNMELIGTTPLNRKDLPAGTHRLRISKKGYVDRIKGIVLKKNESKSLDLKMIKGHTQTSFLDPDYIVFDWTTYDMSFYSMVSSFTFYLGYIYFDVQANQISESIRNSVQQIALFEILDTLQNNPALFAYQWNLILDNSQKAGRMDANANVSAGIGISMILGAVWFFYKAVSDDEKRDTGEVGWFINQFYDSSLSSFSSRQVNTEFNNSQRYELGWKTRF